MIMWESVQTSDVAGNPTSFFDAVQIWIRKPHVVNRRLCGARIVCRATCTGDNVTNDMLQGDSEELTHNEAVVRICTALNILLSAHFDRDKTLQIVIRDMIPKCTDKYPVVREAVVIDEISNEIAFFPLEQIFPDVRPKEINTRYGYKIKLESHHEKHSISLQVLGSADLYNGENNLGYTLPWLKDTLITKLCRWSTEKQLNTEITSLRLLPVDRYNALYQELKKKYGLPLVEKWPEKTDPQKFVYEDVAIATYLLLLWEDDRQKKKLSKKQSFVDLGCGNGLLVYILESEGHKGLGLDLRKRKIWDIYDKKLNLVEEPVIPSDDSRYPEYDWLIGNHSDELTPWIPVMAARSSYECCFFVLPCCPWDFSAKFGQKSTGTSQYRSYLNFVQEVGLKCGFNTEEDTLRIPSTRRVCFIGRSRSYQISEENVIDAQRKEYINSRCVTPKTSQSDTNNLTSGTSFDNADPSNTETRHSNETSFGNHSSDSKRKWASSFQARESKEMPRNCIAIDTDIKNRITSRVFAELLIVDDEAVLSESAPWYPGASIALSDAASLFEKDTMQKLKSECGGLQTLLRNSHHIFRVQGGKVALRNWTTDDYEQHQQQKRRKKGKAATTERKTKTKLCYFYQHHPQGCPLEKQQCRFAHGESDLVQKQNLADT